MMDRLRSPMQTLGVTAFLICALCFAGPGPSHARPSNASQSVDVNEQPCNDVCEAYMTWSHRVSAMFGPSRPLEKNAAHHDRPPRTMIHHAPKTRQPGLNSFAQFPAQRDATPESAETPQATQASQAEVAPSRPIDTIADRFPAAGRFMMAKRAGTDNATNDAAERTAVAVAETIPATQGTGTIDSAAHGPNMRLVASLLLTLGSLPALVFWWRLRARRDADRDPLPISDRAVARARHMSRAISETHLFASDGLPA